jgi:hypothetical protein
VPEEAQRQPSPTEINSLPYIRVRCVECHRRTRAKIIRTLHGMHYWVGMGWAIRGDDLLCPLCANPQLET